VKRKCCASISVIVMMHWKVSSNMKGVPVFIFNKSVSSQVLLNI